MTHDSAKDIDMMKNPLRWPLMVLPVKRSINNNPNLGVMVDDTPTIYPVHLYELEKLADVEPIKYQDHWALVDDGWKVD